MARSALRRPDAALAQALQGLIRRLETGGSRPWDHPPAMMSTTSPLRCRAITEADLPAVSALLSEGFPDRPQAYWQAALEVLRTRETPEGYPRFGLALETGGICVGVLLQIFSRMVEGGCRTVRCNVSSWYVMPAFRGYATLLVARALRHKEVTYVNVSPAEHTWPILEAQGYSRYSDGQFACLPGLSLQGWGAEVRRYVIGEQGFAPPLGALLDAHSRMGLLVLVCSRAGERAVFAFLPRDVKGVGRRVAQLAYCADTLSFTRFAGPLGRWLTTRGLPLVILDSCGPVAGLVGRFFKDRAPKYFRGAHSPRLNDLAYTEAVLFGA